MISNFVVVYLLYQTFTLTAYNVIVYVKDALGHEW